MPGGRPGPALFELLRDKTGTRSDGPARPVDAGPHAPVPPPAVRVDAGPAFDHRQSLSVSMSAVWLAVSGVIVAGILIWVIAFSVGRNRGESDALRDFKQSGGGPITEPLRSNTSIPVNPNLVSPSRQPPPPGPASAVGATPGSSSEDPRIAGFNYLTLASRMDRETAARAVTFLSENGVKAFWVPVVKSGSSANNATYTVYALQGITREALRANAPVKTDLEEAVKRLAKVWMKEHKGKDDFSRYYWDKYGS